MVEREEADFEGSKGAGLLASDVPQAHCSDPEHGLVQDECGQVKEGQKCNNIGGHEGQATKRRKRKRGALSQEELDAKFPGNERNRELLRLLAFNLGCCPQYTQQLYQVQSNCVCRCCFAQSKKCKPMSGGCVHLKPDSSCMQRSMHSDPCTRRCGCAAYQGSFHPVCAVAQPAWPGVGIAAAAAATAAATAGGNDLGGACAAASRANP
eukprot:54009-Pelagomonas_calceolata.AAC.1